LKEEKTMRFSSTSITLAIAAAATTVSAVFVPHDQPDGNYAVSTDENGQDVHTFVSAISYEKYTGPSAVGPEGEKYASSGDGVKLMDKRWLEGQSPCVFSFSAQPLFLISTFC